MVLFDEDPVTLISETTNQFHIAPDKDALARVSDSLRTLAAARQARLDRQSSILGHLTRRLNNLQGQYAYEEERHDAGKHAEEMLRMDTEKFRTAKSASDAEIEGERMTGELRALKAQLATLEREGVEGGARRGVEEAQDEHVLKLSFYHSLGIDATRNVTTGEFTRAVVRNPERGDVHVVGLDGTMSQTYYANMIWQSL